MSKAPGAAGSGKRDTLRRMFVAARHEFATNGLAGARIDDIAQASGVTKQLIYHYYESKEKLFASVLAESSADVMAELVALNFDHLAPPDAMRGFLNHMFDQYDHDPHLRSLSQEGSRYHESHQIPGDKFSDMAPALVAALETILTRGVSSGEFRTGIDARIFSAMAALVTSGGFTNRFMISVLAGFDTTSAEGMAAWRRHSADFILASIGAGQSERPAKT